MLCSPAPLGAQPAEPPVAGRPAQYGGVVGRYRLEATAAPTAVHVEEPVTLRVRITGQGPAAGQPRRDRLHLFPPELKGEFYVEDVPAEDRADPARGTWEFVYRLRPRHAGVEAIAGLKLVYYDPDRRRYQTARPDADLTLTVKPRPQPAQDWAVAAVPAPASFYALAPVDPAPTPSAAATPDARWLALYAVAVPLLCWLVGRRWSGAAPDRSAAAARQALHELDAGAEPAWLVTSRYLRRRLGYPGETPTPADVARFLKRRGLARPVSEQARSFYAACDAARFAPAADGEAGRLRDAAARLIRAVEADRSVR